MVDSFGDTVGSLLETYSKCLALLKRASPSQSADGARAKDARLLKTVRSDRSKVRRAYSSRLSKNGGKFAEGDAKARSLLRRVMRRLRAAMQSVIAVAQSGRKPSLDYESLMSLSNSSRADAILAINDLSGRVSVASSYRSSRSRSGDDMSMRTSKDVTTRRKSKSHSSRNPGLSQQPTATSLRVENRVSRLTISSDSTKLGEIPGKIGRAPGPPSRYSNGTDSSSEQYSIRPIYPIRPYKVSMQEREKKGFWGFLRR